MAAIRNSRAEMRVELEATGRGIATAGNSAIRQFVVQA